MKLNRRDLMGAALAVSAMPAFASTPALADVAADEADVRKSLEAFRAAVEVADSKALDNLSAPQLSYSHSNGRVEDKATFIAHDVDKYRSLEFKDITVSVVNQTAIVRFHWLGHRDSAGKPDETSLAVLTVWQKQGGAWKLLARASCKA